MMNKFQYLNDLEQLISIDMKKLKQICLCLETSVCPEYFQKMFHDRYDRTRERTTFSKHMTDPRGSLKYHLLRRLNLEFRI